MNQRERLAEYRKQQNPLGDVLSHIQVMKGEKGEQGKDGINGKDGTPGRDGAQGPRGFSLAGPRGPAGNDGENGKDGAPGKDGTPGANGKDADPNIVADIVVSQLSTGTKLKPEHIEGLPKTLNQLITFLRTGGFRGGGSLSGAATPTTTYIETPAGVIDGANKTYTTTHTMTTVFSLAINGQFLHPTVDYTFSGVTITLVNALAVELAGTAFTVVYQ